MIRACTRLLYFFVRNWYMKKTYLFHFNLNLEKKGDQNDVSHSNRYIYSSWYNSVYIDNVVRSCVINSPDGEVAGLSSWAPGDDPAWDQSGYAESAPTAATTKPPHQTIKDSEIIKGRRREARWPSYHAILKHRGILGMHTLPEMRKN